MALRLSEAEYAALITRRKKPVSAVQNRGRRWEDLFAAQLDAASIRYEREHRAIPDRRFRFDFAMLPLSLAVAVEIDGAVHRIKGRFLSDREKGNIALLHGWRVLHVAPQQVRDGTALTLLQSLLNRPL